MDEKRIDVTFLIIGTLLTILIPIIAIMFYKLTFFNIFLTIFCVFSLDLLCYFAHKAINKK